MKLCLYFTSDLMFTSRVKPLAVERGFEVQFPGFQELNFESQPELVIFDLEFVSHGDLAEIIKRMQEAWTTMPKTVAYAPHVKQDKIEAAKQSGVEEVWTRGQFNKGFESLFQ